MGPRYLYLGQILTISWATWRTDIVNSLVESSDVVLGQGQPQLEDFIRRTGADGRKSVRRVITPLHDRKFGLDGSRNDGDDNQKFQHLEGGQWMLLFPNCILGF